MRVVRAKKHLGQHFLTDEGIAQKIGETLIHRDKYDGIIEVGPGNVLQGLVRKINREMETKAATIEN